MIKLLACTIGEELNQLAVNADIDTTDIVGGFGQLDISRKIASLLNDLRLQLRIGLVESLASATILYPNVLQWIEWLDSHGAPTIENHQRLADRMKRSNSHV
jgi:midasin